MIATAHGRFPLLRGRAWIEEVKAEFHTQGRVGHGVLEHVFRPGPMHLLRHGHEFVRGLGRAFLP